MVFFFIFGFKIGYSTAMEVFQFHAQYKKLGNWSSFMTRNTIMYKYELPCVRKNLLYWPIYAVEVAGTFPVLFCSDLGSYCLWPMTKTLNTPHHNLDGMFHSLLACWCLWAYSTSYCAALTSLTQSKNSRLRNCFWPDNCLYWHA